MNVLVVSNAAPFIRGGAEELAEHLVIQLQQVKGVDAELLRIPFTWEPADRIVGQILLNKNLRLANVDRVIAMKFPAYIVPHDNKTFWLMHQYRQAYDLDKEGTTNIPFDADGDKVRAAIRIADKACFASAKEIFTISPVVSNRLMEFNGVRSSVLHHPLNDPEAFIAKDYQNYVFAGGRISSGKRQHILIEAMKYTRSNINLVVVGPAENQVYVEELKKLIEVNDLNSRVQLKLGFAPRAEIIEYVNRARACASIPIDEDSMSYVAMEAFAAGKSVVTALDSGGLLELVKDKESGYVVPPQPREIAKAFDALADINNAMTLGRAARNSWTELDITWASRIDRLLG